MGSIEAGLPSGERGFSDLTSTLDFKPDLPFKSRSYTTAIVIGCGSFVYDSKVILWALGSVKVARDPYRK